MFEVVATLVVRMNITYVHRKTVWSLIFIISVQLKIGGHELDWYLTLYLIVSFKVHHFSGLDIAIKIGRITKDVRDGTRGAKKELLQLILRFIAVITSHVYIGHEAVFELGGSILGVVDGDLDIRGVYRRN